MPKQVRCPKCKTVMKVPASLAGKKVKCPKCGQVLQMPPAGGQAASAPATGSGRPAPPRQGPGGPASAAPGDEGGYALASMEQEDEDEDEPVGDGQPVTCSNCGKDLDPGTVICVRCGTNVKTGEQLKTAMGTDADKKATRRKRTNALQSLAAGLRSRKLMRGVIGLVMLGGIGLGVYWYVVRKPAAGAKASGVMDEARALVKEEKFWEAYQKVSSAWVDGHRSAAGGSEASDGPSLADLGKARDELAPKVDAQLREIATKIGTQTQAFFSHASLLQETADKLLGLGDGDAEKRTAAVGGLGDDWAAVEEAYDELTAELTETDKACGALGELTVWYIYAGAACAEATKDSPNHDAITAHLEAGGPHYKAGQQVAPQDF